MVQYQKIFTHSIKILNLSPKELKAVTRIRGIKGYKSMPEDRLLSAVKASELLK